MCFTCFFGIQQTISTSCPSLFEFHVYYSVSFHMLYIFNLMKMSSVCKSQVTNFVGLRLSMEFTLCYTIRGTRRCPGWPMAKPDSNFVYYITKKGGRNKLWKCVRVKCAPCYVRKVPQLTQKHTRARRRQHCEWIQCLVRQLIGKQRHVTKLECYRLFEMSLKFFVFPSGAGM